MMLGDDVSTGPSVAIGPSVAAYGPSGDPAVVQAMCAAMGFGYDPTTNSCMATGAGMKPMIIQPVAKPGLILPAAITQSVVPQAQAQMPGGALSPQYMPGTPSPLQVGLLHVLSPVMKLPPIRPIPLPSTKVINLRIPSKVLPTITSKVGTIVPSSGLQIAFQQVNGLWFLQEQTIQAVAPILDTMSYQEDVVVDVPSDVPSPNITGTAFFVAGQTKGNFLDVLKQRTATMVALLDKNSVTTGVLKLVFTTNPATVAQLAGVDGTHAILGNDPQTIITAAQQALLQTPPGQTVPGAVTPAKTPWLLYGLVGLGVLTVGYFVLKPKKAVANRRKAA